MPNKRLIASRYFGCDNPTDDMIDRGLKFIRLAQEKNAEFDRTGLREPKHKCGPKVWMPSKAKEGMGKLWLECFRDFAGDECILYPFRTAYQPYGVLNYNFKQMGANRAMCLMTHGLPKEDGKTMALHKCGNGHLGCVNPKHLYWGDQSDNSRDARQHSVEGKQAA